MRISLLSQCGGGHAQEGRTRGAADAGLAPRDQCYPDAPTPIGELSPVVGIDGEPHVMVTQAIAGIPAKELRCKIASRAPDIQLLGF
jgi:hypothetical protein